MKPLNMHVASDALHVRTGPDQASDSSGLLHRGLALQLTEIDATGTWAKVSAEGTEGWCSLKYLLPAGANQPPWLAMAHKEIGIKEIADGAPGLGHHPRILEYLATVDKLSDKHKEKDETDWCSCFVNWCVEKSGHDGTNSARAQSWHKWRKGKPPESVLPGSHTPAALGDIAVGQLGSPQSVTGHVAFFIAYDEADEKLLLLGGNQSNSVCYQWYPLQSDAPYGRLLSLRSL